MFGAGALAGTAGSSSSLAGSGGNAAGGGSGAVPNAWGCSRSAYGDGKCDCGCAAMDPDCKRQDLDHCEVCNSFGSCNRAACPGNIDPSDITRCTPPPEGWTCTPSAYGDGTTCDCGCGIEDKDCPDTKRSSCNNCEAVGSCANGACPSAIAADDNTRCEFPPRWSCDHTFYGDGKCDCGCGAVDIDCPDASPSSCAECPLTSCASAFSCPELDPNNNAVCTSPPNSWQCPARLYNDGSQCDCGCDAVDPDCTSLASDVCDKCDAMGSCSAQPCPGLIADANNARCAHPTPPPEWRCAPATYGDSYTCDCGCGIPDPDCRTSTVDECEECPTCGYPCKDVLNPADTTQCNPPPSGWTCDATHWGDYVCDCGCGVLDPACNAAEVVDVCTNYPVEGCSGGNRDHIDFNHNELCSINAPSGWTCSRGYYDDGICDCGCGVVDYDCASNKATACAKCNDDGACSTTVCPSTVLASDNAHCSN
jgi:hypothetical protein